MVPIESAKAARPTRISGPASKSWSGAAWTRSFVGARRSRDVLMTRRSVAKLVHEKVEERQRQLHRPRPDQEEPFPWTLTPRGGTLAMSLLTASP
jgi:hypothetical protein